MQDIKGFLSIKEAEKLQELFKKTGNIAVPSSYFKEIKAWSENELEKKKSFFSSNSNKELVKWLKSQKTDVILISRGDPPVSYTHLTLPTISRV